MAKNDLIAHPPFPDERTLALWIAYQLAGAPALDGFFEEQAKKSAVLIQEVRDQLVGPPKILR